MPDPTIVLLSLERALSDGMSIDPSELDGDSYKMFYDEPNGGKRYSFTKIVNGEVQALSIFGLEDPIDGFECYNVGYAVKKNHRGRELAVEAVNKGIEKLRSEFSHSGRNDFYVEAVIDVTNHYSIKVAEKIFNAPGVAIIERFTEKPALHFKKMISAR